MLITKTWPNDVHEGCVGDTYVFIIDLLIHEKDLIDKNEVMIEEGVFDDDGYAQSQSILEDNPPCMFNLCYFEGHSWCVVKMFLK